MSKASTKATKKYQDKVGIKAHSFKLKKTDVDSFRDACQTSGETQASVLTRLMTDYVKGIKHNQNNEVYPISCENLVVVSEPPKEGLTNDQKREYARELLLKHPDKSNPEIVKLSGGAFAKDTVRRVRNTLIESGELLSNL